MQNYSEQWLKVRKNIYLQTLLLKIKTTLSCKEDIQGNLICFIGCVVLISLYFFAKFYPFEDDGLHALRYIPIIALFILSPLLLMSLGSRFNDLDDQTLSTNQLKYFFKKLSIESLKFIEQEKLISFDKSIQFKDIKYIYITAQEKFQTNTPQNIENLFHATIATKEKKLIGVIKNKISLTKNIL